jgi:hypothetical protein
MKKNKIKKRRVPRFKSLTLCYIYIYISLRFAIVTTTTTTTTTKKRDISTRIGNNVIEEEEEGKKRDFFELHQQQPCAFPILFFLPFYFLGGDEKEKGEFFTCM